MVSYARADVLVETGWLQEHLGDPNLRIVESNEDPELYAQGHIPGAIHPPVEDRPAGPGTA